jgi:hypothetical protein
MVTDVKYHLSIIIYIILAWTLLLLFEDFVTTFFYKGIGLDKDSAWDTFFIFAIALGVFLIFALVYEEKSLTLGPFIKTEMGISGGINP